MILERSSDKCFFACEIILRAHLTAASYPSSVVKLSPILPLINFPSTSVEICPEIKRSLSTCFVATYEPTGSLAFGKIKLFFFIFSSKIIFSF